MRENAARSRPRAEPMIIAPVVLSLVDLLHERGFDALPLLARHGLAVEPLSAFNAHAPLKTYVRLFEEAALQTAEPGLGLSLSSSVGPEALGALGFLFLSSSSLGDALANLVRYTAAVQDATEQRVAVRGGLAHVTYQIRDDAIAPRAQDAEFSIGCTYRLIRSYVGPRLKLAEAHFEHSPLQPPKTYEAVFRCPVYFQQPTNGLVLAEEDLKLSSSVINAKLFPILEGQIRELISKKEAISGIAERVADALSPAVLQRGASAAKVANDFNLSESTLHRRLKAEGTSFQAVLDQRRLALARRLLDDRQMTIADIAAFVGFSENAAFTRAFKRWTGVSPRDYRGGA